MSVVCPDTWTNLGSAMGYVSVVEVIAMVILSVAFTILCPGRRLPAVGRI